ncbi:nucleotide-binding universal stress UspA family protein [Pedobacter sp. UYP30]|uniref:universal stress protein n=1 Tax=Pedobacter sp. UYP30 TaxID=1756400 RepID=UPI003393904C
MKNERILIVADDSPSSLKAIKYGFYLAGRFAAKIALIGVVDEALAIGDVDAGIFPETAELKMKKFREDFLNHVVKDYANGIDAELFTPEGNVKDTVLDLAREWEATMIVAGSHGRKGLNRLLMGSVAEGILRDSKVPVVVVPMDK